MISKEKRVVKIGKNSIELTHEDKVLYPKGKITKNQVITYYQKMAPRILSFLKDRPLVLERFPSGITKEGFFQKKVSEYFPSWIKTISIPTKEKGNSQMVLCNNLATLLYLVNQGSLTFHVWLSKVQKLDYPDRMIFDLDPPSDNFSLVKQAAKDLKALLEKRCKLSTFLMTTGSKGLHIVVPIRPELEYEKVRAIAKKIASYLAEKNPEKYTINPRKNERKKKLFLDYLRNAYGQTAVAPYCLRALDKAPIATPISWEDLSLINPQSFTLKNHAKRMTKRADPWKGMASKAKSLRFSIKALEKL